MAIRVNLNPYEATAELPQIGHTITYNNSDWTGLYSNPQKAQRIRSMVEKVLNKTGAPIKVCAMVYKVAFQAGLLYGRKIWVVTDTMAEVLEGFNHRVERRIERTTERNGNGGEWEWDLLETEWYTTGIFSIREYVMRHKSTITEYVSGRPIYKLIEYRIV